MTGPIRIHAFNRPFAPFHDLYQRYYQAGMRAHADRTAASFAVTSVSHRPRLLGALRALRDKNFGDRLRIPGANTLLDAVGSRLEGPVSTPSGLFVPTVGQYVLTYGDGSERRLCIDAGDAPEIPDEALRAWSDVYLKTNYWSERAYPDSVRPMVNADPLMLGRLDDLQRGRSATKSVDLSFVVRIWGGTDGVEGIEHNLRLLEAIDRVRCDKRLLAVLPPGDTERTARLLRLLKVPATTHGISPRELWELTGRSRLNVIRLGVHYCVPWRMTGALAVGACVVLDRSPLSIWPEPLRENVNFLSLGALVAPGVPVATDAQYDAIPGRIEEWLGRPAQLDEIREANRRYFDGFLAPEQVGRQIAETVEVARSNPAAGVS